MRDGKLRGNERDVKRLLKGQQSARTDAEIPEIENAGKRLERMEKELAAVKKKLAGQAVTIGKLWKWKMEQEKEGP